MKTMQKIIHAGFATCALASASMPALSWTVWPNIDFEWYADVGKPPAGTATVEAYPAPRMLYDRQGNPIPTSPEAYPVDSARR